jgi:hypothetical protein
MNPTAMIAAPDATAPGDDVPIHQWATGDIGNAQLR